MPSSIPDDKNLYAPPQASMDGPDPIFELRSSHGSFIWGVPRSGGIGIRLFWATMLSGVALATLIAACIGIFAVLGLTLPSPFPLFCTIAMAVILYFVAAPTITGIGLGRYIVREAARQSAQQFIVGVSFRPRLEIRRNPRLATPVEALVNGDGLGLLAIFPDHIDVRADGVEARIMRSDVEAVMPGLGSCTNLGFVGPEVYLNIPGGIGKVVMVKLRINEGMLPVTARKRAKLLYDRLAQWMDAAPPQGID